MEVEMPKRWSKLQKRLYGLMEPSLGFQLHCALYEMNSNDGWHSNKLPRYWISIGKEIVFDYPKDFDTTEKYGFNSYPWDTDISQISNVIEEYIQCPESELMNGFTNDRWGITNILLVCDRRMGSRRLKRLAETIQDETLLKVIAMRLNEKATL